MFPQMLNTAELEENDTFVAQESIQVVIFPLIVD